MARVLKMNIHKLGLFVLTTLATTTTLVQPQIQPQRQAKSWGLVQNDGRKQQPQKAVPQSPFTPPQSFRESFTKRVDTTPAPTTTAALLIVADAKNGDQETHAAIIGSPFSPPTRGEWRESKPSRRQPQTSKGKSSPWLDSVEERQRENVDSIPPLANIEMGGVSKDVTSRRRFNNRPKTSMYQENSHRDMHDAEPGVTPWTRYTDKPRVKEEQIPGYGKAYARCGQRRRYNPRKFICCEGRVVRRHGVSPACCKGDAYDTAFNKCCNGVISVRTHGQADC